METKTVNINEKTGSGRLDNIDGTWKLTYKTIGTLGVAGFGGLLLSQYKNPKNHKDIYRQNPNGLRLSHLMISQINTIFTPDEDPQDRLDVEWMIHHPDVIVEGYKDLPDVYKKAKKDTAQLTLTALDYQERDEIEEIDFIDRLVGRLSLEGGTKAIGLENLRYVLAELNKSYRDARYIKNPATEKKVLRSNLKGFIKGDYKNAKLVHDILNRLPAAKVTFELKEMIRVGVIQESNGMFKYDNIPLGVSIRGILNAWEQEPELKISMQKELMANI